jgi:hypothetical protein
VVPLATAAVVEDRLAAVCVAYRGESIGDLAIAVSQSISSNVPSGRGDAAARATARPPFW